MTIEGVDSLALTSTTFENSGSAVWLAANITFTDATFDNYGTFEIQTDANLVGGGLGTRLLHNRAGGTVAKTAGGVNAISVNFATEGALLLNGLSLELALGIRQSGANSMTDLMGGTLWIGPSGQGGLYELDMGTLKGGGAITGSLVNTAGTVEVGDNLAARTLAVWGSYTQGVAGKLRSTVWDMGGGAWDFGKLDVWGTATLAGDLLLALPNGNPPANTTGTVLSAGTRVGVLTAPAGWTVQGAGNNLTATKT